MHCSSRLRRLAMVRGWLRKDREVSEATLAGTAPGAGDGGLFDDDEIFVRAAGRVQRRAPPPRRAPLAQPPSAARPRSASW